MSIFTKQEFLELVSKLTEQQYDLLSDEEEKQPDPAPYVREFKAKMKKALVPEKSSATTDLTNVPRAQLMEAVFKTSTLKIHNFTIKITQYHGEPDKNGATLSVDFTLYHEVKETPNLKAPCKMTYPCNVYKDTRFKGRQWLKFFDVMTGSHATNIPTETLIDIVRWIQVVVKFPAFL